MRSSSLAFSVLLVTSLGCGSESIGSTADPATGNDGGQEAAVGTGGAPPDGEVECCTPDKTLAGCMNLGGTKYEGHECITTCDFYCSYNWRIEKDQNGCDQWKYDVRPPVSGETPQCQPDYGPGDGGPREAAANIPDCGSPEHLAMPGNTQGRCPSQAPVCKAQLDPEGAHLVGAACEPVAAACANSPSCDCLVQDATFEADGGRKTACYYLCQETSEGFQLTCSPP